MVQIENLAFNYNHKKILFDRLNLTLPPGHIYGLLGKNGAGKSTLLKLISGLLFPKKGNVEVAGLQPKERLPEFLREIYLVTEEFQLPPLYVNQFIALYSPFYPRFDRSLFDAYIHEFQLPLDDKLSSMSYGQKKKFLLCFGLATDCKLLILDEPVNGLDIPSKSQFRKVVASAIHEDRSFVISTHQVRDMENLIDPIIILDEGKIAFYQSYEQITKRLTLARQSQLSDKDNVVYHESSVSGYTVVKENTSGEETSMNLELLFKAVISNPSKVSEIFKSNQS